MKEEIEIWKDITGYEGYYKISSCGRVFSVRKNKVLKPTQNNHGYLKIRLSIDGIFETFGVHQLVAIAFLNHKRCGFNIVVDHIDGDRCNNNLYNIRLVTNRQNSSSCYRKNEKNKTSKFIGVCLHKKTNKWVSHIMVGGKRLHLGFHNTELDASELYIKALKNIENGSFDLFYNEIKRKCSSNYWGVSYVKASGKWKAQISINKIQKRIGIFSNEEDARDRYNEALEHVKNKTFDLFYESIKRKHSSKYKGVGWNKHAKKWRSTIKYKGKSKCIGYFINEIDAANAYKDALTKIKQA